jgi:hypothetical protein
MAPPMMPPAIAAPTPRWAWAGAGATMAETAKVATAAIAVSVFFMASPFSLSEDSGKQACQSESSTFRLNDQ